MVVTVRLFAGLRERAGRAELELDLPDGARVSDALAAVQDLAAGIPLVMAVNREYAAADAPLAAGDELALIPPVSGGAGPATIIDGPLLLEPLLGRVRDPGAGAVVTFSGVTRDVPKLDYEAYAEMAGPVIERIVDEAAVMGALSTTAPRELAGGGDNA